MFSKNVPVDVRYSLIQLFGFRKVVTFGKYLCVPLSRRAPRRFGYNYLIEQVKSKLA